MHPNESEGILVLKRSRVRPIARLALVGIFFLVPLKPAQGQPGDPGMLNSTAQSKLNGDNTSPAAAPTPPSRAHAFGSRGQTLVLGSSDISFSKSSFSASSASVESLVFSPDIDYFVLPNVSVGLALDLSYADAKGDGVDGSLGEFRATTLSGGVHFGFNLPLGSALSWFPQVTIGYESTRQTDRTVVGPPLSVAVNPLGYASAAQSGLYADIYAPFLFHVVDHFFFGFGPEFFHDFGSEGSGLGVGGQRTQIGAAFVVGAYWGGEQGSTASTKAALPPLGGAAPSPAVTPRFGDQGEIVFTNSLVASVNSLIYPGLAPSLFSAGLGGSVDWFVFRQISLGLAGNLSYSRNSGIDTITILPAEATTVTSTLGPRLGLNVPIGKWISIYPVIELGFGTKSSDLTELGVENKEVSDLVTLNLFVPLLVHPAPHVFVGFGPAVYTELSDSVSFPNEPQASSIQNREVAYSAGLVMGGWL
jgi:hypothetical protein